MKRNILFFMPLLLLMASCKKSNTNCEEAVCPAIFILPPPVKFNVVDKNTDADLFFSSSPQYSLNDLIVYVKKNNSDTSHIPFYIDSSSSNKHFITPISNLNATYFIQIQNNVNDTIEMIMNPVFTKCCLSGYAISSLKLNGVSVCTSCDYSTIIKIKK